MSTKIFVNLPVKDLNRSMAFFKALGYTFNKQFTNEKAACLVISEDIYTMLLTEKFFKGFIKKEIADSSKTTEAIMSLMVDSRKAVDDLYDNAIKAGGKKLRDTEENGGMYGRSFEDLDGHLWEVGYMDPRQIQKE